MAGGQSLTRRSLIGAGVTLLAVAQAGPLLAKAATASTALDLRAPDGRIIAVTEWRPQRRPKGIILFSHGAGSSPRFYDAIILPWVQAGYHVLAPLNVDSREHPRTADFPGLASWKARIEDMRALVAHIGDAPFIAAGHSYGGLTALVMGGVEAVVPDGITAPLTPRFASAVVAFSPPSPIPVLVTEQGYATLAVPALIQTGTLDIVPGITSTDAEGWRGHLAPFDAAALGGKRYGMVLDGADHYFGGAICDPTKPGPPQTAQLADANAIAALFLDAYGRGNAKARQRLDERVSEALPVRLMRR